MKVENLGCSPGWKRDGPIFSTLPGLILSVLARWWSDVQCVLTCRLAVQCRALSIGWVTGWVSSHVYDLRHASFRSTPIGMRFVWTMRASPGEVRRVPVIEMAASMDEMTLPDKDVANHLTSLPGMRRGTDLGRQHLQHLLCDIQSIQIPWCSFERSYTLADGASTQFIYNCCQARGTANDMAKQLNIGKEKQRVVHHMEHFDCHSKLHISLHNGIAVVSITHCQSANVLNLMYFVNIVNWIPIVCRLSRVSWPQLPQLPFLANVPLTASLQVATQFISVMLIY